MNTIITLQKEKEELEIQFQQVKDGAIESIMEKEKIIYLLQEQIEQAQFTAQNQIGFQHIVKPNNQKPLNIYFFFIAFESLGR